MDAINSNYSQFAANFASKLSQINVAAQAQGAGAVAKEQSVTSGSQVTLTQATDKVAYVASHPQLAESANLTAGERSELLQSTSEKLVSAETTCRGNRVMFDIYAVLALIQKTSQEMRNAQRDLRKAEVMAITSSIMAQAAMQRTAALTQLITSCVSAGISLTMLAVSAAGMGKNVSQANQRQNAAGLDTMKQQKNLLACSDNPDAAGANLESMKTAADASDVTGEVDAAFAKTTEGATPTEAQVTECETNFKMAAKDVETAQGEYNLAHKKLSKCTQGTTEYHTANRELIAAGDKLSAAETKQTQAKQALTEVKEGAPKAIANEKAQQMGGVVDKCQSAFDKVAAKASYELETTGKVSTSTKQELKVAGDKLNYARAKQVDTCAKMTVKPTEYMSQTFKAVDNKVSDITAHTSVGTAAQQKSSIQAQMLGNSAMMAGQLVNSIGQGLAEMIRAEATALQADQRQAEEGLDQIKDLFNNTQQVIQQSIQVFQSVTQKESQSIEEIIGGIRA